MLSLSLTLMCPLSGSLSFFVPLVFSAGIVVPGFRVVHHRRPRGRHAPAHGWRVSTYPRQLEKVVQSKGHSQENTEHTISHFRHNLQLLFVLKFCTVPHNGLELKQKKEKCYLEEMCRMERSDRHTLQRGHC